MTQEEKASYIQSQSACAMIEAMGMQATNNQRTREGLSWDFTREDFNNLITKYGIDHNSVVNYLS